MFTGIVEALGEVVEIQHDGSNTTFWISAAMSSELKVDQSVAHNGVCLTVEAINSNLHKVTAIDETLKKTNLNHLTPGSLINLERCLALNGRLDGHLVQGHVDTTAVCLDKKGVNGSWEFTFEIDLKFAALIIEKGSICLNGISLTIFNVSPSTFSVAIIPYTYQHTNIQQIAPRDLVNIEFDMIGKYVNRIHAVGSV